jgi:hydrogenase expression/formation protein HypC
VSVCLAIPGQVVAVLDEAKQLAQVDVAGVRRTVNIALLGDDDGGGQRAGGEGPGHEGAGADHHEGVGPGDWVLIHVGFALSKIDEREAHATLELLREMSGEYEQTLAELSESAIE